MVLAEGYPSLPMINWPKPVDKKVLLGHQTLACGKNQMLSGEKVPTKG